jgi:hypothetical protein
MTVYLVISLPKVPYMHRLYMVLANPTHVLTQKHRRLFPWQEMKTKELDSALASTLSLRYLNLQEV